MTEFRASNGYRFELRHHMLFFGSPHGEGLRMLIHNPDTVRGLREYFEQERNES